MPQPLAWDHSKPETRALYQAEVQKRIDEAGMNRDQAEMLVAVLMANPPVVDQS